MFEFTMWHANFPDFPAVLGLSQDGACTNLFENFRQHSLKRGLSNDTTVNPPLFSLVNKVETVIFTELSQNLSNILICCLVFKGRNLIFIRWDPENSSTRRSTKLIFFFLPSVLGIRIRMFLGLPDPDADLLVTGMDPAPDPNPSLFLLRVLSGLK
jgi:hypothetical protein